ncbi:MAG: hypothetical protein ACYDDE_00565 [bacterium]
MNFIKIKDNFYINLDNISLIEVSRLNDFDEDKFIIHFYGDNNFIYSSGIIFKSVSEAQNWLIQRERKMDILQ